MKTLHLSIITITGIAVIGIIIFAVILPMQPKKITDLDEDIGIVTMGIQSYYFTTVNDTMTTYRGEGVQELFHNVVFTFFPSPGFMGPIGSCGGINFGSDVKFSDGMHELLQVPLFGSPCGKDYLKTDLSNHTNPQAGLTVYDEKIKLLVSTDSQTIEKKFSVIQSQTGKQSRTVDAAALQCENEFKPRESQHTTLPNGTSLTTNYVPVFLMKPNSTGKICITNNIASQSTDQSFILAKTTSGISKENSETSDVTVVPYPESIVIDNTTKTIVYTIITSKDANGFYRINTTFDFCGGGIPLAVGYNSSHLFDNDFPWLGQTYPCPFSSFQSVQTQITGLTGIDVAYITKVYS